MEGKYQILESKDKFPKGAFVVVHGLNNHAQVMIPLIKELNKIGFHAINVTLAAHEWDDNLKHTGSADNWQRDINKAYCILQNKYPKLKIYNLGFSMGAAVTQKFLIDNDDVSFEKQILFAPAIKIRWFYPLLPLITWMRHFDLSVINFLPKAYRRHFFTPVSIFHAMQETIDYVAKAKKLDNLHNTETLIVISNSDELVDPVKLKKWVNKKKLNTWNFLEIEANAINKKTYQHLIIDKVSVGKSTWKKILERIESFL